MLRPGANASTVQSFRRSATRGYGTRAPEFFPINRMFCVDCSLEAVKEMAERPEVEWIDLETIAPVRQLID